MTRMLPVRVINPAAKRTILIMLDAVLAMMSMALMLTAGSILLQTAVAALAMVIAALATVMAYSACGMYRGIVSQMTADDGRRLAAAAATAGLVVALTLRMIVPFGSWLSEAVVFFFLLLTSTSVLRLVGHALVWHAVRAERPRLHVAIYGAGQAGVQLAAALERSSEYHAVAFFDDDPYLQGRRVRGLQVLDPAAMAAASDHLGIRRILLAIPSASRQRRREIVSGLETLALPVNTIPDLEDIATGRAQVGDLRAVDIEELLQRDPVPPLPELLGACIAGKNVMVTGGAGSIGSELCRQIIDCGPRCLVVYEFSEVSLYGLVEELAPLAAAVGVGLIPVLGTTQDRVHLDNVCGRHSIDTIYHAAAYKHVPILEDNPAEGVRNNIVSTRNVSEAAVANAVEVVVLISSDKAVRPSSIMGASKRFSELIVQAMAVAQRKPALADRQKTRFCMVRFGNVLGSSGSVVPKFRAQIAAGGPVTVTHPEVVRYFMTIPEAAQLVLQAGALAADGEIFVLDMGPPVRILDLARRMVRLSGLSIRDERTSDGDIAIEITGLRAGEKLYEELLIGSDVAPTVHPRISRASEPGLAWNIVSGLYDELIDAADCDDERRLRAVLQKAIPEFVAPAGVEGKSIQRIASLHSASARSDDSSIIGADYQMNKHRHGA